MDNDDDMLITPDGLPMEDIGSQHYQWSGDIGLTDELANYFILTYDQHCKAIQDGSGTTDDDDENDTLFLQNWQWQDIEQLSDVDVINKNSSGLVAIDVNQPSVLLSRLKSGNQRNQRPTPVNPKACTLPVARPPPASSKPPPAKFTNKKSTLGRHLQPKDPNQFVD